MPIWSSLRKIDKNYPALRDYYLKQDITQSRIIFLLIIIPCVGFVVNDYSFFGISTTFEFLIAIRMVAVLIIILSWAMLGRVKEYRNYDRTMFIGILATIICGGAICISRPDNFLLHAIITIVSIFITYLMFPLKYIHQIFLASFMSIGEGLIIVLLANSAEFKVAYTLLFSMLIANVIAAACSGKIHSHRKTTFEEFNHRKALQDSLEQQANQLSDLVMEKTRELVEAQSRLIKSERFAAIGQLAGMVGHDLRNPLTGIKNAVYILRKKEDKLGENGICMLDTIDQAVEHADSIVSDLLDYSREVNLQLEDHSSKSLVTYALLSVKIPSSIRVTCEVENEQLRIDQNKIQRVFVNLIKNAVEAMPNGGQLDIKTLKSESYYTFVFTDSGVGMTEEVSANIFTPLFTTKAQGMGLGLAICKRLVESHNGKIAVKSVINKGTEFMVSLPVVNEK